MKMMYSEYLSLIRKIIECIEHQEKATSAILMTKVEDDKLNLYKYINFINLYLAIRCLHFFKRIKQKQSHSRCRLKKNIFQEKSNFDTLKQLFHIIKNQQYRR